MLIDHAEQYDKVVQATKENEHVRNFIQRATDN